MSQEFIVTGRKVQINSLLLSNQNYPGPTNNIPGPPSFSRTFKTRNLWLLNRRTFKDPGNRVSVTQCRYSDTDCSETGRVSGSEQLTCMHTSFRLTGLSFWSYSRLSLIPQNSAYRGHLEPVLYRPDDLAVTCSANNGVNAQPQMSPSSV